MAGKAVAGVEGEVTVRTMQSEHPLGEIACKNSERELRNWKGRRFAANLALSILLAFWLVLILDICMNVATAGIGGVSSTVMHVFTPLQQLQFHPGSNEYALGPALSTQDVIKRLCAYLLITILAFYLRRISSKPRQEQTEKHTANVKDVQRNQEQ